jgi:hypothetical protein
MSYITFFNTANDAHTYLVDGCCTMDSCAPIPPTSIHKSWDLHHRTSHVETPVLRTMRSLLREIHADPASQEYIAVS